MAKRSVLTSVFQFDAFEWWKRCDVRVAGNATGALAEAADAEWEAKCAEWGFSAGESQQKEVERE